MIDWGIIIAALVLGILIWASLECRISDALGLRRLKSQGRSIEANKALADYENGLGVLVRNRSSMPGDWWFLRNDDRREGYDLVMCLREFGYVVTFDSKEERRAIEAYSGRVEELLEPFED